MGRAAFWISAAFWMTMMALLVRTDVAPRYAIDQKPSYQAVLRNVETPTTREMIVYSGTEPVGTSQTVMTPEADGTYRITNITNVNVQVAMFESKVSAVLEVLLDPSKSLESLTLKVGGAGKRADVTGRRIGDRVFLDITLDGRRFTHEVPYDDAMFSSYFEPFSLGARLKIGQRWRTRFLDPLEQRTSEAEVEVTGRETVEIISKSGEPRKVEALRVVMKYENIELKAWATEDGTILKEETPFGYTLIYKEAGGDDSTGGGDEEVRREDGRS